MGRLLFRGQPKNSLKESLKKDPFHKHEPAIIDSKKCAGCGKSTMTCHGKVRALPDSSDNSEFGTKRLCNACYQEEEAARKAAEKAKEERAKGEL